MYRPEQALQIQVARFIDAAYPALLWLHVPNGGARSKVEGAIFKAMGVKAGATDLFIILPDARTGFIELKAGKGKLTPQQEAFRDRVTALGCFWAECRSVDDVEAVLSRWLQPFGWRSKARLAA
jgi:hypothetical protein